MTRLAVIGSVNLDFVASAETLPAPGETVGGAILKRHPGGKGANQALAARRLGAEVSLYARVGADSFAQEALKLLRTDGVDLSHCAVDDNTATGVALIAVARDGENQIVVAPGANATFAPALLDDIDADALLCQLEISVQTIAYAAARFGGLFAINLAPAAPVPAALLQRADLIVVNQTEAGFYGASLHAAPGLVAITYGARGATLFRGGSEIARSASPRVKVVDTTGAGDAFCAALTLALVQGTAHAEALAFACTAGALAATKPGAQPSLPWRGDVDAFRTRAAHEPEGET
jgi:ribokinase